MSPSTKRRAADDSDEDQKVSVKSSKKTKHNVTADGEDDDGNPFWELSNKRRVGVSQFKNVCLINVREYYEKDGKMLPGKKGISLSVAQYTALLKAAPGINAALRQMGQAMEDVDDLGDATVGPTKKPKKEKKKASKANIDATSDEED
ncbi:Transcriptional Coactivator p15 family protein, partial [Metarhizium majus ARSEF 297]